MKGLPGLIQLNQWKVDEQRRKVTELEILSERLADEVAQLQSDIEREGRNSGEDMESSRAFSAFLTGAMAQRETLRGSIADLQLQISAAKDDLADAYRELKSYEVAQAKRDSREARKQELRDRVKMDEIGMSMFRRKSGAA
jgi:flagellar protein FliJ